MGNNGRVLTIKEASKITGLSISALRMHLKKGLIEGVKRNTKFGDTWLIKADSLKGKWKVDSDGLNMLTSSNVRSSETPINDDRGEHLNDLRKVMGNYENLLTTFQARITNLEAEKAGMEEKLRMLPAPVETIVPRLNELEQTLRDREHALARAQEILDKAREDYDQYKAAIVELKEKLQEEEQMKAQLREQVMELQRPWWKKMLGLK